MADVHDAAFEAAMKVAAKIIDSAIECRWPGRGHRGVIAGVVSCTVPGKNDGTAFCFADGNREETLEALKVIGEAVREDEAFDEVAEAQGVKI